MCDPVLIRAILEELGYLDEKEKKDKKAGFLDEKSSNVDSKYSEEERKEK